LPIGVERVDFVSIPVRDLARARRFYGEVLALPPGGPAPDEFEAGNVTLALWAPEADGERFTANEAGVALRVADVAAARRELEAGGVELLGDVVDTGVCEMAFLHDSEGNVLILHRRYAGAGPAISPP
jgi:catechol 2,3-dioxygenase-like lactoylglutathione lyase family enzyme